MFVVIPPAWTAVALGRRKVSSPLTSVVWAFTLAASSGFALMGCSERAKVQHDAPAPPAVSVVPAVERSVNDKEEFSGRLEAIEFVDVRPRISGTIDQVHFKDGSVVQKGDLLFTIDPLPFEAQVARTTALLAAAEARSQLASLELTRATTLLDSQAASRQEVEQLTSGARTSLAELQAAEAAVQLARLNLGYTRVRAPISGRISRALLRTGNLVDEQSLLTSIAGVSRIYAYFDVSEQSFLRLKAPSIGASPARVQLRLANESEFQHAGQLDFIDNRLSPQTGAIRLRASFDNAKGDFTPGLAVRIRLESPTKYSAVLVPEAAIGTDQSKKFVYVIGSDSKAQYREVIPGALFDAMRVVRAGVKPGESVVVNGLQRVMPGGAVAPQTVSVDANGAPTATPASTPAPSASSAKG